jgi:hypothetical protein
VDVMRGSESNPGFVWDLKTGTASLKQGRIEQIQNGIGRPVPVQQVKPQ